MATISCNEHHASSIEELRQGNKEVKMKKQINKVWEFCNPMGQWFTFAKVGTGSNSIIVTLHAGKMIKSDKERIGTICHDK